MGHSLLIIQPKLPSYRWSYFQQIAEHWDGPVRIIYGTNDDATPLASLKNDTRPGAFERSEVPWTRRLGRWFLSPTAVMRIVDQFKPDVVVVPGDINEPIVHLLSMHWMRRRIRLVCMGQYRRAGAGKLVTALKPHWHRIFDGVILYNQVEAGVYLSRYGYTEKRLTFLNNGLDQVPPAPGDDVIAQRHASGHFLICGRLEPKNRFDLALQAFADYRARGGKRKLLVVGDGTLRADLERLAIPHVEFLGAIYDQQELANLFRTAAAMVHPCAVGLSLNLAFGYGCPAICCRDPDVQMPEFWVWREGVNGVGFELAKTDSETISRISACMVSLDAQELPAYSSLCREAHRSVSNLTTERMAERSCGLFASLVKDD